MRVLDIGCGPGYLVEYFPDAEYVGIDIDEKYIRYAQRRYAGRGHFASMYVTRDSLKTFEPFDVVVLAGVLHHVSDSEAVSLLAALRDALKPGGKVVTLDCCYVLNQSRIAKFLIDNDRGKFVRDPASFESLARSAFTTVHSEIRQDLFQIPYTLLVITYLRSDGGQILRLTPAATERRAVDPSYVRSKI